jgi:diguanylate cyclase (GGDEF)-like protein
LAAGTVLRGDWASPPLLLLVALVAYFACQAAIVGGVIALSAPTATLAGIVGSRRDNLFAALVLCAGALLALATGQSWIAPLFGVPLLCAADWAVRQVETARGDARTDDKTGLLNNRGWNEEADRELARARRTGSTVSVAVLDLDHFKVVNDTWGHPAGDAVLRAVGEVLRETVRKGDVIGRFGGEEFVLLLPDSDATEAGAVAERVRAGIAAMAVVATDKRGAPVVIDHRTVSIGLSVGSGGLAELDALLRTADAAVYDAKTGGRDQVRVG